MRLCGIGFLRILSLLFAGCISAQSPNGIINGLVLDPTGGVIAGAEIRIVNDATAVQYTGRTNGEGIYVVTDLPPGTYRLQVSKIGFKTLIKPDIILNVQDSLGINFTLPVGAASETITVTGGAPLMNTESAAVSTVVDRQFAENLPMNGRSFQTLIQLTPGAVLTVSSASDSGQFSVNGQRAASNYWMVDGVSANIGVSSLGGNGFAGALGSFSVQGGTNSLVSVDAMQEFRILTSTYAPEFGRTPGGQISIVTRSGANQFHGTAFDYLRNDIFDARDWFDGYTHNPPLAKAQERQNDFGGTFSGPILKDKSFFFFSYEGLRLRLPQTTLTSVPDSLARQDALPALQPFLNAYPFDPKQPDLGSGIAQYDATYSNPSTLDAYSLRIDHRLNDKVSLFGRYNYSPSQTLARGGGGVPLSGIFSNRINTQTLTVGTTWMFSSSITNDLRFNYSRTSAESYWYMDDFGGAVPLASVPFPSGFSSQNSNFSFDIFSLTQGALSVGKNQTARQQQINVVENLSVQKGSHSLKFGVDFRRLTPSLGSQLYSQAVGFLDVPSAGTGTLFFSSLTSGLSGTLLFRNLGAFAQDTWRVTPRLTVTYGLRWDVDFAPSSINGPSLTAATGFNLNNLVNLALAPPGTPPFKTPYGNVAPRIGAAYQLKQRPEWQTVIRGGFGVFFDLATQEVGNNIFGGTYPFGGSSSCPPTCSSGNSTFPLSPAAAAPPPIVPPNASNGQTLYAFNPHIQLPYTLEWNVAIEQALGNQQTLSASYVGSAGRRLIQTSVILSPNPNLAEAELVTNGATSSYDALQMQFQRRLSRGLQVLASYVWSHSIDDASAGSAFGNRANALVPGLDPEANRGPSDFDIRNAASAGITYEIPAPKINAVTNALLRGWSTENFMVVRSAPPVNVTDAHFTQIKGALAGVRPDVVPGEPFYLYGSQYPGHKAFNPAAFMDPPVDPSTGLPLRQGDLPRNSLRGFNAAQWDFAIHRSFPISDSVQLQFRAEMFNVLNHPNFAPPSGPRAAFGFGGFGVSNQTLGEYLGGGTASNVGGGAFSALYQIGGPRSIQFALKVIF
jgi:outer membrane receptor protein involved in Fe transport